jgi:hypothetical protein
VRGRDLDRLLELVDEVEDVRARQRRARALGEEIARDEDIVRRAPAAARDAGAMRPEIVAVTRTLERQWVAQSPLVAAWQRATELLQLAESAGVDAAAYRADADAARRRVESARLGTRDGQERLAARRRALADVVLAAPFDVPVPAAVRDDDRPEAIRRDALALAELTHDVESAAGAAVDEAASRLGAARQELAGVGEPGELARRLTALEARLPRSVSLPPGAPPSVTLRLERAGVRVEA